MKASLDGRYYYCVVNNGKLIEDATASSYIIPESDVTSSDDGKYYFCVISNGYYSVTSNIAQLTVEGTFNENSDTNIGGETIVQTPQVKLAAPTISVQLLSSDSVNISWNSVSGASKYRIYRATSEDESYSEFLTKSLKKDIVIQSV